MLSPLERIAANHPVEASHLERDPDTNVASAQRAIGTLAEEGRIGMAPGRPPRWVLTAHINPVAQHTPT